MKLSNKTFLYSIFISAILVGLIVIYFVTMLPSLYVDYMKKQNLEAAVQMEKGYMKNRNYSGMKVSHPTSSATLEIPFEGNEVYLAGKGFRFTFETKDETIKNVLEQVRTLLHDYKNASEEDFEKIDWDILLDSVTDTALFNEDAPVNIKAEFRENEVSKMEESNTKAFIKDDLLILEAEASDQENRYTSYFVVGQTEDAAMITMLALMTPQMKEIKDIVLESVPMIAAVIFLIVLICSQFFSRKIMNPVIRLANYADEVKAAGNIEIAPLEVREKDEIGDLGRTLNELYAKLRSNYAKLEEESKRQEIFLRASSHQLKTPIAAAMLLVDGMIQEIGKYKDKDTYLPQVKVQLKLMQKIVEDILYLNHCTENLQIVPAELISLINEVSDSYKIQMENKNLAYRLTGESRVIPCDVGLLKKILDNLLSNAVSHTEEDGEIRIEMTENALLIFNRKAHIEEELLPHICEPFVSSADRKGKGLGLYVSSYYLSVLGMKLQIENHRDGVRTILTFS